MGTPRLLLPMWLAALALHGVVGLYWYSIGPGEYRFPTLAASALFAGGLAAIAWWWVRAEAIAAEKRPGLVSTREQLRHKRMALLIACGLFGAVGAIPAGVAGNDVSWHRFNDGDPVVVSATATALTREDQTKSGWIGYYDGYVELGEEPYRFRGEPVYFDSDGPEFLSDLELWAVFDHENPDAGFVVEADRESAEDLLAYGVVPMYPFVLAFVALIWAVHSVLVRRRNHPERVVAPVEQLPATWWWMPVVLAVLWGVGVVVLAHAAAAEEPFQPMLVGSPEVGMSIGVWLALIMPAAIGSVSFFYSAATKPLSGIMAGAEFMRYARLVRERERRSGNARDHR